MNRTQRAKIRSMRKVQNLAKKKVQDDIFQFGRGYQYLKCDSKTEKRVRNDLRKSKVAIKLSREAVS